MFVGFFADLGAYSIAAAVASCIVRAQHLKLHRNRQPAAGVN